MVASLYKVMTGYDDKEDMKTIDGLKREHKDAYDQELKKHEKTIPWDAKGPTTTYSAELEKLKKDKEGNIKNLLNCQEQAAKKAQEKASKIGPPHPGPPGGEHFQRRGHRPGPPPPRDNDR